MPEFNAPHPTTDPSLAVEVVGFRFHDTNDLLLSRTAVTVLTDGDEYVLSGNPNELSDYSE